jgi:Uma2 family endonuclease
MVILSELAEAKILWHRIRVDAILEPIRLHAPPELGKNNDWLFDFCRANPELRIERKADGEVLIMSPEAASSGSGNIRLGRFFDEWAERNGTGRVFGSSAGFILPNGAMRSPDLAWVSNERLAGVAKKHWKKFLPVCPDFVLELRSPTDRLRALKEKMEEYIANGAKLGWLLDPESKEVHVYRARMAVEILKNPTKISGETVLTNFSLDLRRVWAAMEPNS